MASKSIALEGAPGRHFAWLRDDSLTHNPSDAVCILGFFFVPVVREITSPQPCHLNEVISRDAVWRPPPPAAQPLLSRASEAQPFRPGT